MTGKRGLGPAQAQAALSLSRHQPGSGGAAHVPVVLQVFAPCLQCCSTGLCCSARCLGQTTCQMIVIPTARPLSCSNINYSAPPGQPSPGACSEATQSGEPLQPAALQHQATPHAHKFRYLQIIHDALPSCNTRPSSASQLGCKSARKTSTSSRLGVCQSAWCHAGNPS